MIRTRAIIEHLSYDDLVKQQLIPDIVSLIKTESKRYPPFIYKTKEFSYFGVLTEYVVRAGIRINIKQEIDLGTEPIVEAITTLPEHLIGEAIEALSTYHASTNINDIVKASYELAGPTNISYTDIQGYIPSYVNIIKALVDKWNYYTAYLQGKIIYNTEYTYQEFAGHPDVVIQGETHSTVLDIKNTASFAKMSKSSSLQVLAYYALMKATVPNIRFVGFILPMQREILLYDLGAWDSSKYLEVLNIRAKKLMPDIAQLVTAFFANMQITEPVLAGSHISKGANIATTLLQYAQRQPGLPCQMFLANPRTGKRAAKTANQIAAAAQVIRDHNIMFFVHAPYVINLCANKQDDATGCWQQRILNEDLAMAVQLGGRGVVVHTGAKCGQSEEEALNTMEYMVRIALAYATETCPLLLESPSGEGTEVVTKIEELGNFFFRFTIEERKKLGVCIDSCHIFSASYDPLAYMEHWERYCQTPIRLVHFNDSATPQGSRVDRHAAPGQGYIGMDKMNAIAQWCKDRNIPMVRE